jgi:hypothetical protein
MAQMRTVRSTSMNDVSSRSHAIFQIVFTQTQMQQRRGQTIKLDRVSKLSLVDLAGSERSGAINAGKGERLKEGNVINKSLSSLGKVISTLADRAKATKKQHVPYRDSVLTWLLKESLGGNSKTIMLAAISPALVNFDETLSTLRYANQAKNIVNTAVINEDSKATVVRQLKEEIDQLRAQLSMAQSAGPAQAGQMDESAMMAQLEETEKLLAELSKSWEDKLQHTLEMQSLRIAELRAHGIVMGDDDDDMAAPVGVMAPNKIPYLVNLSRGTALHETQQCLLYYIKEGFTPVNRYDETVDPMRMKGIVLVSEEPVSEYCVFHCTPDEDSGMLVVTLMLSEGTDICVNDRRVKGAARLRSGDIITIGRSNIFRFDNPEDIRSASPCSMMTSSCSSSIRSPSPGTVTPSMDSAENRAIIDRAQFAFEVSDQTSLLSKLFSMHPGSMEFKLLPAYGCYLMLCFCRNVYADEELAELLSAISLSFERAHQRSENLDYIAFWMANTVELLMALRTDQMLCPPATQMGVVGELTQMVEDAYSSFVVKAMEFVLPTLPSVILGGELMDAPTKGKEQKVAVDTKSTDLVFGDLLKLLKQNLMSHSVTSQLFASIFFRTGASLFNIFLSHPEIFECNAGLRIRFNLSRLSEWARNHRLNMSGHLLHITQASQLLQTNKSSLEHLGTLNEACGDLNAVQLRHILGHYRLAKGEAPVPPELVSCITAMVRAKDKGAADDDGAGSVQLERNASHLLPFRLTGDFHMNYGLVCLLPILYDSNVRRWILI